MSEPQEQSKVYVREFLNKEGHETHAFIMTECTASGPEHWKNEKNGKGGVRSPAYHGYATVGDCSRTITLDFNITDHASDFDGKMSPELKGQYENVHDKVKMLRDTFDVILKQMEVWKKRNFK